MNNDNENTIKTVSHNVMLLQPSAAASAAAYGAMENWW